MGILSNLNNILSFEESQKLQTFLKKIAIRQFLKTLQKYKKCSKPQEIKEIKWGQQIQGNFLILKQNGTLELQTNPLKSKAEKLGVELVDQFCSFMFEMNATKPYNTLENFDESIREIRRKYALLQKNSQLIALTIPSIPFLGLNSPENELKCKSENCAIHFTHSNYLPDSYVSSHPRYQTLNRNICQRRNHKINLEVPLFMDLNTKLGENSQQLFEKSIHLDCVSFGLGVSSLQCTFSTKNLNHARYIHDQLNILSPIFLALTAGTPFHKGKVSQWDVRWPVAQGTVDDRTQQEKDPSSSRYIPDSRYCSTNYYLWDGSFNLPQYSDYKLNITQDQKNKIKQHCQQLNIEIDDKLLSYLAYIMKRDMLIVKEEFNSATDESSEVFELLNGTIWNSVRLKIPCSQEIGWRVEFRTMEVQLTPDQNAAYILIIHFLIRILHENYDLNLYLPTTKLRENFIRAFRNDALRNEKFYFRTNVFDKGEPQIQELTAHEIFFGKEITEFNPNPFKGLYHIMIQQMQKTIKVNQTEKCRHFTKSIQNFLRNKTQGKMLTLAQWMRKYVSESEKYKKDSIIPKQLIDEMLMALYDISRGKTVDENFHEIF